LFEIKNVFFFLNLRLTYSDPFQKKFEGGKRRDNKIAKEKNKRIIKKGRGGGELNLH